MNKLLEDVQGSMWNAGGKNIDLACRRQKKYESEMLDILKQARAFASMSEPSEEMARKWIPLISETKVKLDKVYGDFLYKISERIFNKYFSKYRAIINKYQSEQTRVDADIDVISRDIDALSNFVKGMRSFKVFPVLRGVSQTWFRRFYKFRGGHIAQIEACQSLMESEYWKISGAAASKVNEALADSNIMLFLKWIKTVIGESNGFEVNGENIQEAKQKQVQFENDIAGINTETDKFLNMPEGSQRIVELFVIPAKDRLQSSYEDFLYHLSEVNFKDAYQEACALVLKYQNGQSTVAEDFATIIHQDAAALRVFIRKTASFKNPYLLTESYQERLDKVKDKLIDHLEEYKLLIEYQLNSLQNQPDDTAVVDSLHKDFFEEVQAFLGNLTTELSDDENMLKTSLEQAIRYDDQLNMQKSQTENTDADVKLIANLRIQLMTYSIKVTDKIGPREVPEPMQEQQVEPPIPMT